MHVTVHVTCFQNVQKACMLHVTLLKMCGCYMLHSSQNVHVTCYMPLNLGAGSSPLSRDGRGGGVGVAKVDFYVTKEKASPLSLTGLSNSQPGRGVMQLFK